MVDELDNTIAQNAQGPASANVDGVQVSQHSLRDQVVVDKHFMAKKAGRNPLKAFVRAKVVAPGTVQ